ncbi:MAG TPA: glycosyltransferase family A protein [Candidatus Binatia bacterium]|nr:glycosyltransferase family A protein [Candidatus Binatia bacterium]
MKKPKVSVLMPTYNQDAFIRRALASLCQQSLTAWELLIVDDGSTDDTRRIVQPHLKDERIHYRRLPQNTGRGAALNLALEESRAPYIAYLPSDDVFHQEHLASLLHCLEAHRRAPLAYSGVRYNYNRKSSGKIDGMWLQMVQVMHRRSQERWLERADLVSDDLGRLYWDRLGDETTFVGTGQVSCEWVAHAGQLHRLLQEPKGGINTYRERFQVSHPLRFHTTRGNYMDEVEHYRQFRERADTPRATDGLKIVLAGELAYNPERVLALEERGHKLYGLWMPLPYWYNSVGPVPFGHVEDLPRDGWQDALAQIQPDIIYALLNWQAVPFIHELVHAHTGVPLVWHFKEGPFICLEKGSWPQLIDIHRRAAGQIFCTAEMRDWYETVAPGITCRGPALILDGDLPKREWFGEARSPRLSDEGNGFHTVVPGRPIGLHPHTVAELAEQEIHLHFYGDFTRNEWLEWIEKSKRLAPGYLHLHSQVDQDGWTSEFSRYDAGWLHWVKSSNQGDVRRADWDDLNVPARITTLVSAGLPLLQYDNEGAVVATQSLSRDHDIGIFFSSIPELGEKLRDQGALHRVQENVWRQRQQFTFDHHADRLLDFFRLVIAETGGRR